MCAAKYTMDSQPHLNPNPTWRGVSMLMASCRVAQERYLDVICRSTSPPAINCKPPFFSLLGIRDAPHKCGMTAKGTRPELTSLTTSVKAERDRAARSGEGQVTASWRWWALRREEPGAELAGKDFKAQKTEVSLISVGVVACRV